MSNHAVQRPRLGRVAVLASALLALAPLVRGAQQAPECLIEIHDQSGNVTDGSTLCSVAGSTKSCTFNLALCHNVSGCAVGALKKKLHATGHCNPGHLKISPTDSSCSGAFTGIKVPTRTNASGGGLAGSALAAPAYSSDRARPAPTGAPHPRRLPSRDACEDGARARVSAAQVAGAHQELARDLAAGEAEGLFEELHPLGLGARVMCVEPGAEGAEPVADAEEAPRILDGGIDL